jgi:hypothetical protein
MKSFQPAKSLPFQSIVFSFGLTGPISPWQPVTVDRNIATAPNVKSPRTTRFMFVFPFSIRYWQAFLRSDRRAAQPGAAITKAYQLYRKCATPGMVFRVKPQTRTRGRGEKFISRVVFAG